MSSCRQYFAVVAAVIMMYDYFLTLERGVEFIWPARLTPANTLYSFSTRAYAVGISTAEVILALRTWAIWGRNARFDLGLGVALVATWLPVLVLSHRFPRSLVCERRPPHAPLSPCSDPRIYAVSPAARVCFLTGGSVTAYIATYALFLASDTRYIGRCVASSRVACSFICARRTRAAEGGRCCSVVYGIVAEADGSHIQAETEIDNDGLHQRPARKPSGLWGLAPCTFLASRRRSHRLLHIISQSVCGRGDVELEHLPLVFALLSAAVARKWRYGPVTSSFVIYFEVIQT
ncbi:hypothetical protein HETIRDRAFT_454840 [Heterobasidion irregulare TC 32-1]|uniref:DUF6533 domain-containing protein n=1 Tax=Heterobasidion irregulare (strain TC 32-1) TaxID=747525 RepID=W4JVS4_HETIT|nr:uncharacterized protein HETIRDRAFT_454840 [Heterobasidion irregulare TC 32-1]ETW77579.1 hypothetical protein HETIRDRAFT_454840 [Heterobasidion irregulare TC 32-1]